MKKARYIVPPNREVILDVLSKVANDHIFMTRLVENL